MVAADGGRFDAAPRRHAGPAGARLLRRRSPHQLGLRLRRRARPALSQSGDRRQRGPGRRLRRKGRSARGGRHAHAPRGQRRRARDGLRLRSGQRRRGSRPAAGHRGLRRDLRHQVFRQEAAALLGAQRREDRRTPADRVEGLPEASRALRGLRQGTDGRHDASSAARNMRRSPRWPIASASPPTAWPPTPTSSRCFSRRRTPATATSPRWTCSSRWTRSGSFSARRWRRPRWSTC